MINSSDILDVEEQIFMLSGVKDWMLCNSERCHKLAIEDRDPFASVDDLEYLLHVLQENNPVFDRDFFIRRGKSITQINTSYAARQVTICADAKPIELLPDLSSGWNLPVDHRPLPESLDPRTWSKDQVFPVPAWKHNSCWLDCFFFIAKLSNAVVTQIDQLEPKVLERFGEHIKIFRRIMMSSQWNPSNQTVVDNARDKLRRAYAIFYESKYEGEHGVMTDMHDIQSTFQHLFQGLPSFTMTTIPAWQCCDGKVQVLEQTLRVSDKYCFTVPIPEEVHTSMSTLIQSQYMVHSGNKPFETQCSSVSCTKTGFYYPNLVLDRPAPYLLVKPSRKITADDDRILNCFTDCITITYRDSHMERKEQYVPQGCVYFGKSHFVAAWKVDNPQDDKSILFYDGIGAKKIMKGDWWDVNPNMGVVWLVYYRSSAGPRSSQFTTCY